MDTANNCNLFFNIYYKYEGFADSCWLPILIRMERVGVGGRVHEINVSSFPPVEDGGSRKERATLTVTLHRHRGGDRSLKPSVDVGRVFQGCT